MDKIKELIIERVQESQSLKIKYEDSLDNQEIYKAKKAEKLRQIKENILIDALFNFGQASKSERQLFEAQSSEVMTYLNYKFQYQPKNRGLFSDVAEMYISFFESLMLEARAEEIRIIAKYNLYQNFPFLCMLLKWLIEISRKIFVDIVQQVKSNAINIKSKKSPIVSKIKNLNTSLEKIKHISKCSQIINSSIGIFGEDEQNVEDEQKAEDKTLKANIVQQQNFETINFQEEGKQTSRIFANELQSINNRKFKYRQQLRKDNSIDKQKQSSVNNSQILNAIPSIGISQKIFDDSQKLQNKEKLLNQFQRNCSNIQSRIDDQQIQYKLVHKSYNQKLENFYDKNDLNNSISGECDNKQKHINNEIQGNSNKSNNILIKQRTGYTKPLIEKSKKRRRDMVFHNIKECVNDVEFIVQNFHDYLINYHIKLIQQRNVQIKNTIDEYRAKSEQNYQNTFCKLDPGLLYQEQNKLNTQDQKIEQTNSQQVSKIMNTSLTDKKNIDNQEYIEMAVIQDLNITINIGNHQNTLNQNNEINIYQTKNINKDNINNNQIQNSSDSDIKNNVKNINKNYSDNKNINTQNFVNHNKSYCYDLSDISLNEEQEKKVQLKLMVSNQNNTQQQNNQNLNILNQINNNFPLIMQNDRKRFRALSQQGEFQQNVCKQDKSFSPFSQNSQCQDQPNKEYLLQNSIQFKQYQFVPQFQKRNSPDYNRENMKNIKNNICDITIPKNTEIFGIKQNTLNTNTHLSNPKYQNILNTKQPKLWKNLISTREEKPACKAYQYQLKDYTIDIHEDCDVINNTSLAQNNKIYKQNQSIFGKDYTNDLKLPNFNQNKKYINTNNENQPNSCTPKKTTNSIYKKFNYERINYPNTLNKVNITEKTELVSKQTQKQQNILTTNSDCFKFEDEFSNAQTSQNQNKDKYKQPKNTRILFQQIQNTQEKSRFNNNQNSISYQQSSQKGNKYNNCITNSQSVIMREIGSTQNEISQLDLSMRNQQTKNLEKQISLPTDFQIQLETKNTILKQQKENQIQQNKNNQYRSISQKQNQEQIIQKAQRNVLSSDAKQNEHPILNNNSQDVNNKGYYQTNNNLMNKLNTLDINQITYQYSS